jgi:hypothetical protein
MSDDRTKADKAWEARQEAARYRIFNAATNAAEATDEADEKRGAQGGIALAIRRPVTSKRCHLLVAGGFHRSHRTLAASICEACWDRECRAE